MCVCVCVYTKHTSDSSSVVAASVCIRAKMVSND